MMTDIVITMIKMTDIDLSRIHNDATTVKAYGRIPGKTRSGLKLAHGISKDYRPDLKQLVYTLSVSADGAVPIHYKTYAGNRTDDTTHIETWNTLLRIIGKPSFLYVADCKVCTEAQLFHIVSRGGRVVTIIPETRKEVKRFKNVLRQKKKHRSVIWRRRVPGSEDRFEYFSSYGGSYRTQKSQYKIYWILSNEKRTRDRKSREQALRKTEQDLAELSGRLNTRNLKTKEQILDRVHEILKKREIEKFFHVSLSEIKEVYSQQIGPGRPGLKTRFKTITKNIFALSYARNQ